MGIDFLEHQVQTDQLLALTVHVTVSFLHYFAQLNSVFYLNQNQFILSDQEVLVCLVVAHLDVLVGKTEQQQVLGFYFEQFLHVYNSCHRQERLAVQRVLDKVLDKFLPVFKVLV